MAAAFLMFLKYLRKVILQDAAAMLLKHPERGDHCYFKMPCFQGTQFEDFKKEMHEEFERDE